MNRRLFLCFVNIIALGLISFYYLGDILLTIVFIGLGIGEIAYVNSKGLRKNLTKISNIRVLYRNIFSAFLQFEKGVDIEKKLLFIEDEHLTVKQKSLINLMLNQQKTTKNDSTKKVVLNFLNEEEELLSMSQDLEKGYQRNMHNSLVFLACLGLIRIFLSNCINFLLAIALFKYGMIALFLAILLLGYYSQSLDLRKVRMDYDRFSHGNAEIV